MEQKQEKILELQMLEQQFSQIEQNLQRIEQEIMSVQNLKINLKKVKKRDVLANLDKNIFVPAKISEEKFFISIGAGIVIKKDRKGVEEILERQIKELEKVKEELEKESGKILKKFNEMGE